MSSGMFCGARHFILNQPQFVDNSSHANNTGNKGSGLNALLRASMREAFHDSSVRYPPPRCHPGTRQEFINNITKWGLGGSDQRLVLWMHGPAGVGKSAVAQSCADLFTLQNKLGASIFFSHPNERNDPGRLFTSISYQIAIRVDSYGDLLDYRIQRDQTLVTKSIKDQFQDLLVKPVSQLGAKGVDIGEWVIIVDGLDECEGREVQCDIIEMVATSVREKALPFRWIFFSRSEPHMVTSFTMNNMQSSALHLELRTLPNRRIPEDTTKEWFSGHMALWREIDVLVNLSAGLWIYPATIVRFVRDPDSSPVEQLSTVLALAKDSNRKASSGHPLTELDLFYTFIMRRIPSKILPIIQRILLLNHYLNYYFSSTFSSGLKGIRNVGLGIVIANALGLTEFHFRNACVSLHSVLTFESPPCGIRFYHASFMEFLGDVKRSKEFCFYSCLNTLRQEFVQRLNNVHAHSITGRPNPTITGIDVTWQSHNEGNSWLQPLELYRWLVAHLLGLCGWRGHPLDPSACIALLNFQFRRIPYLMPEKLFEFSLKGFGNNIPVKFRQRIVRRPYNPIVYLKKPDVVDWCDTWIVGEGKNKVVIWEQQSVVWIASYPNFSWSNH
ncbi:hypothetical protein P691DRAFT_767801 [Macrolepiota fuliginosa MF-IS2]|uniref:Nephrocystin 3-like N-terminal domain-containing protein n=1 Tax=Macrolepiota fuliginosa MF-IS2 TaxID=1400762 RepID=A0A9P5WYX5_9AGAR|nr:hypothetical protein P691DRAFT_767801 [Macrolepiota fuliginosa MF-IS2]